MLEELAGCLSLVIGSMSALSDFFKKLFFKFRRRVTGNSYRLGCDVPVATDEVDKVSLFLSRQHSINVLVVAAEGILGNAAIFYILAHSLAKVELDGFRLLLTCDNAWMV